MFRTAGFLLFIIQICFMHYFIICVLDFLAKFMFSTLCCRLLISLRFAEQVHVHSKIKPNVCNRCLALFGTHMQRAMPYTNRLRCTNNVLNVEIKIVEIANGVCEGKKSRNIPYINLSSYFYNNIRLS